MYVDLNVEMGMSIVCKQLCPPASLSCKSGVLVCDTEFYD
jgi:hypothetical protein